MARFRAIHVKIWDDPDFWELDPDEKLVFIFLCTNSATTESGVYPISPSIIAAKTKVETERVKEILGKLPNVTYDSENKMVFVKNFLRYNGMGRSDKIKKAIQSEFNSHPKTPLWRLFVETYPEMASIIQLSTSSDTPSKGYTRGIDTPTKGYAKGMDTPSEEEKGVSTSSDTPSARSGRGMHTPSAKGGTNMLNANMLSSPYQGFNTSTYSIDHREEPTQLPDKGSLNEEEEEEEEEESDVWKLRKWFHEITGVYPRLNKPGKEEETAKRIRELASLLGTDEMIRVAEKALAKARERPWYLAYFIKPWEDALKDREFFCCGEKMRKEYVTSPDEKQVAFYAVCRKCRRSVYLYTEVQDGGSKRS